MFMPKNRYCRLRVLLTMKQYWLMCHWCKSICRHQYNGTWSVPPREQMFSLSVFLHTFRKKNHPFMTKQWPADWICFKKSYADSTECIERELIALLLEAMDFACIEDNADLSSTHVMDGRVKIVLPHQESRCICYQYCSRDWRKNNHLIMTQQRPTGCADF